ncbi:hypothetical protein BT63DRAFT_283302 [Microthyrium microscopicum]|uniref:Uncharacterized protein n=1 Tax=Microthyrium microscopicum TaxID=703497 RepID=A0A6A6UB65_9PEZI|nr:hypothetical protein BT63DRAFT_283302 [Microthyrium microscopicum]
MQCDVGILISGWLAVGAGRLQHSSLLGSEDSLIGRLRQAHRRTYRNFSLVEWCIHIRYLAVTAFSLVIRWVYSLSIE